MSDVGGLTCGDIRNFSLEQTEKVLFLKCLYLRCILIIFNNLQFSNLLFFTETIQGLLLGVPNRLVTSIPKKTTHVFQIGRLAQRLHEYSTKSLYISEIR